MKGGVRPSSSVVIPAKAAIHPAANEAPDDGSRLSPGFRRDDGRINQYPVSAGPSIVGHLIGGASAVMAFQT